MFQVSRTDERLRNKDEVLVMHFNKANSTDSTQLAIANQFLVDKRVFNYQIADKNIVVLTSEEGANRVYVSETYHFDNFLNQQHIVDALGNTWEITEEALLLATDSRVRLQRYPAQRAFLVWMVRSISGNLINPLILSQAQQAPYNQLINRFRIFVTLALKGMGLFRKIPIISL